MASRQAVLVALALASAPAPLAAQRPTRESVRALHRWVDAVHAHAPGVPDASVRHVAALTWRARVELHPSYSLFIRVLRDNHVARGSAADADVTAVGQAVQRNPGADAFLKRAAVLHGDAAVFEGLFPAPPNDGPTGSAVDGRGRPVPLLDNDEITLTRDGQVLGHSMASWHLPFARSLLDLLLEADSKAKADHREFAGLWYHAIAAYLFANGNFGDAKKHLQHSERVLPEDGRLLFDRGSYAEAFGLPIFQVVPDSGIPDEGKTNGEAERMYRRALDVDPSYVEARVRLARLLDRRGRHDEAQAEIDRALDARPSGAVGFYALIVAGRVSTAQGRYDAALRHYREASALYEHAQSARLGASHAGLMLADVPLAIAPLGGLGADTALADADPWLDYRLGAGREAKVLLAALWERAAQ